MPCSHEYALQGQGYWESASVPTSPYKRKNIPISICWPCVVLLKSGVLKDIRLFGNYSQSRNEEIILYAMGNLFQAIKEEKNNNNKSQKVNKTLSPKYRSLYVTSIKAFFPVYFKINKKIGNVFAKSTSNIMEFFQEIDLQNPQSVEFENLPFEVAAKYDHSQEAQAIDHLVQSIMCKSLAKIRLNLCYNKKQ